MTTREFFHSPTSVKILQPGQSLAVLDNGKPSFMVVKAGKRPRRTLAEIRREAIKPRGGRRDLVKGILEMRRDDDLR